MSTDDVLDQVYPPSEAERSFLAALLAREDATELMWQVALEPKHFLDGEHARIFEACVALRDRGERVHLLTVAEEVANIAIETRMWNLSNHWANPGFVEFFADQVMARFRRQQVRETGGILTAVADNVAGRELDAVVEETVEAVLQSETFRARPQFAPIMSAAFDPADDGAVLVTPWGPLNRAIRGLLAGGLYVVSGDTGSGKSAIALQIASAMGRYGTVIYHSMEMTAREQTQRLIAQRTGIALRMVQQQHYPEGPILERIERFTLEPVTVAMDDRAGLSVAEIRRTAQSTPNLAGIVVDQLSLMDIGLRKGENLADGIARTTKALKILASDLKVPVVLLSQLNREAARSGRPTRHHLYGSSAIANDADVILILHREDPRVPARLQLIVDKNRQGEEGVLELSWQGDFVRAVE